MFLSSRIPALCLAAVLAAGSVRAADVDPYVPPDTEAYFVINVRQILGSGVVKKVGLDTIKGLMEQSPELKEVLKELGLDPLKDIDKIISAGPTSAEQDKGLTIVRGRFDIDKFKERAVKAAKDNKDLIKISKVKDGQGVEHTLYEVSLGDAIPNLPDKSSLFVAFASKSAILAAPSKDYLVDALKVKPDATKATLKNKAFQEMIEKLDDKQSLSFVMPADAITKSDAFKKEAPALVKDGLAKVTTLSFGLTVTEGIVFELGAGTKTADDSKSIKETLNNALNGGLALLALAAMNNAQLNPVIDFVKSIKVTAKDKVITIKGEVTADDLEKLKGLIP